MMKKVVAAAVLCAVVLMAAANPSAATTLMIDPDGAVGFWDQDGRQNACSFTVNSTITVTRLGNMYPHALSGDEFIEVALYEVAGVDVAGMNQAATMLAMVTIAAGDPVERVVNVTMGGSADTGQLYLKALAAPIELTPGTYALSYTMGPFGVQANNDHQFNAAPVTFDDGGGALAYGGSFWDGDQNRSVTVWPGDPGEPNQWNDGLDLDHAPTMEFDTGAPATVANAGEDFFGYESRGAAAYVITLDGTASVGATSYLWEQLDVPGDPVVTLDNDASATPSFNAPQWDGSTELTVAQARLRVRLTINAGQIDEASDEVEVYIRIPGDANGDDVVNAFDIALVRAVDPAANFNGDLAVNAFDLAILRQGSGRRRETVEPVPMMDEWLRTLQIWGRYHGDPLWIRNTWGGYAWYYDGMWVFEQAAKYTQNPHWLVASRTMEDIYLPYVTNYSPPGYRVFPHGFYSAWLRTGDDKYRQGIIRLANNSAYASAGGAAALGRIRETAYILQAYIYAEKVGEPRHAKFDTALGYLKEHLRLFAERETYIDPDTGEEILYDIERFMFSLACHSLYEYEEHVGGDPAVTPLIRAAAEELWSRAWDEDNQSFFYLASSTSGSPDLNLLMAFPYAYLANRFPDEPVHMERFVKVWEGGVGRAYVKGGKQFIQQYRMAFICLDLLGYPIENVLPAPSAEPLAISDFHLNIRSSYTFEFEVRTNKPCSTLWEWKRVGPSPYPPDLPYSHFNDWHSLPCDYLARGAADAPILDRNYVARFEEPFAMLHFCRAPYESCAKFIPDPDDPDKTIQTWWSYGQWIARVTCTTADGETVIAEFPFDYGTF